MWWWCFITGEGLEDAVETCILLPRAGESSILLYMYSKKMTCLLCCILCAADSSSCWIREVQGVQIRCLFTAKWLNLPANTPLQPAHVNVFCPSPAHWHHCHRDRRTETGDGTDRIPCPRWRRARQVLEVTTETYYLSASIFGDFVIFTYEDT